MVTAKATTPNENAEVPKTQAARLAEPFSPNVVKKVTQGGVALDYIPVAEVIKRMNEVLGVGNWSAKQMGLYRDPVNPEWIVAEAEVTATVDGATSTRPGNGAVKIKMFRGTEDPVNLGHDYKGAHSEAMKKACQGFGVGLYLATGEEDTEETVVSQSQPQAARPSPVSDEEWAKLTDHLKHMDDRQKGIIQEWWSLNGVGDKPQRSTITRVLFEELMKRIVVELFDAEPDNEPF